MLFNAMKSSVNGCFDSLSSTFSGMTLKRKSDDRQTSSGASAGSAAGDQSSRTQRRRLRAPSSAVTVVHQEDVKNIAGVPAKEVLCDFVQLVPQPPATEDCCICCDSLKEASGYGGPDEHVVIKLYKCSHMFHLDCVSAMYNSGTRDGGLQCPTCKAIYGVKRGDCPDGTMTYQALRHAIPGFEGFGAIQIMYHIAAGFQNGRHYVCRGFPRYAYLPNNDRGKHVLELLVEAWRRRLTFTIGTSATTGESNSVVWNEIHHKTSITNERGHGYPDPNYLDNVVAELAAQGVEDD